MEDEWIRIQNHLKTMLILTNTEEWQKVRTIGKELTAGNIPSDDCCLTRVGGVDISYDKNDSQKACISLVVVELPSFKVIYEETKPVEVSVEYIAGFLAFREVQFFVDALKKLKECQEHLFPQVVLVDGNGTLHPNRFGMACHLGVLLDIPCIGVAKNLHNLPSIERDASHKASIMALNKPGDSFLRIGEQGDVLGKALKTTSVAKKPVYLSVGHKCELDTAAWVVMACSKHRIPEPVRQADIRSREFLRNKKANKLDLTVFETALPCSESGTSKNTGRF